jgi:glucose/mannose-6-phosphate isomerase
MSLVSRLARYEQFIGNEYLEGFLKGHEYSAEDVDEELRKRIESGQFKRIVFTGMGCSAIVSDVIRGYLVERGIPIDVYVVNDYEFPFLIPDSIVNDESTLIVISSYSGHSNEPILALRRLLPVRDRILLLTSGGRLAETGREEGVSILYWRLGNPDREYPLFHVTQYFAILVTVFVEFGLLDGSHQEQLATVVDQLRADFDDECVKRAQQIAAVSHDANIVLIAPPKWHESLLKLCKMHLNEIAMVPATRNYFHEFCHSEVASLTHPERKHSLLFFTDAESDDYTTSKTDNVIRLLTEDRPQNSRIVVNRIELDQPGFLRKFFGALNLIQQITLHLGRHTNTVSRELISEAAGNPWYHSSTIESEKAAS